MSAFRTHRIAAYAFSLMAIGCTIQSPQPPRVVDINTADGVKLKGTYFAAAKPGPAVLLLHQCDGQRKLWDSLGVSLSDAGINALSVDYRGYGESGGTPHEQLPPADLGKMIATVFPVDIDSALAFLMKQPGVSATHLGLAGASCGVTFGVQLAERHDNLKALALLAGRTDRAGRNFIETHGSIPVFTAAAGDDKYADFVLIMRWLRALSSNPSSRVAQYPTGGHGALMFTSHQELPDTIAAWFSAVLADKPSTPEATNSTPLGADTVKMLRDLDEPGGAIVVGQKLADARKTNPAAQIFPEALANELGYQHMQANDMPGAIAIMKLEVSAYPESANAMDSLGDVYLAAGDKKSALETAKQTLVLLQRDTKDTDVRKNALRESAEQKIKQLSAR
jgi:dienelactone hydrolase